MINNSLFLPAPEKHLPALFGAALRGDGTLHSVRNARGTHRITDHLYAVISEDFFIIRSFVLPVNCRFDPQTVHNCGENYGHPNAQHNCGVQRQGESTSIGV